MGSLSLQLPSLEAFKSQSTLLSHALPSWLPPNFLPVSLTTYLWTIKNSEINCAQNSIDWILGTSGKPHQKLFEESSYMKNKGTNSGMGFLNPSHLFQYPERLEILSIIMRMWDFGGDGYLFQRLLYCNHLFRQLSLCIAMCCLSSQHYILYWVFVLV